MTILSTLLIFTMLFTAAGLPSLGPARASSEAAPTAPDGMPGPIISFEGLRRDQADAAFTKDSQVPDTSGDVGRFRYIQAANKAVAMYNKGGTMLAFATFESFWNNAGTGTACDGNNSNPRHHGQPNVLYDHMAQRWVIMDLAYADVDNGPYYLCVAVSNYTYGENPVDFTSQSWLYYALPSQTQAPYYLPDQARIGLWPDGYYISAQMFDIYNNGLNRTPEGVKVWALNRDDLVNHIVPFRYKPFNIAEEDVYFYGLLPSNLRGDPPPTGTPNYYAAIAPPNLIYLFGFSVDWLDIDSSTFLPVGAPLTTALTWDLTVGYRVDQPNTTEKLDIHGDRLMNLQFRLVDGEASLWTSHTVLAPSGVDDIRWYEIRGLLPPAVAPVLYQEASFAPDTNYRWVSSLGVDIEGNMAIGYSISSPFIYPSIFYTGRLVTDPLNTLPQGEQVLMYGNFYQDMNPVSDEGPWGQRSAMTVDPVDPCIFWYTNQYYAYGYPTNWHTRIGAFRFQSCQQGRTALVSVDDNDVQGDAASGMDYEAYSVSISADGRYVAFASEATNLDVLFPDTNNRRDIYVRDRDADADGIFDEPGAVTTRIVSLGIGGTPANSHSWEVSISGDGRFIAYSSEASNLVEGDTNGTRDVFRYDRLTGATVRVSISSAGIQANSRSDQPSITYYGEYVAFRSYANNLVPNDMNDPSDIFVRNLQTNTTTLASISSAGVQGNADSYSPAISGDGRFVAFVTNATNLVSQDTNGLPDVYVHDRLYGPTVLVSAVDGTGNPGNGDSYTPSISYFGAFIAFVSRSTNLDPNHPDTNGSADVFVRNITNDRTKMISVSFTDVPGNADSYTPSISGEGQFVAFASDASNLDLYQDLNGRRDIFLHDTYTGLTRLVSKAFNGASANGNSVAPAMSFYGRHFAFPSRATNLVATDLNNHWDVFAYDRQGETPTFLSVSSNLYGNPGQVIAVPVLFNSQGRIVDTTTFSIDYDQACLSYNGLSFSLPGTSSGAVAHDPLDSDGELDVVIYPASNPPQPIPSGIIATIQFTISGACQPSPGASRTVRIGFSSDPMASFGSNGQSLRGRASDGLITILEGYLGDCNGDVAVDAGDLTALVLEIFDQDGNVPADTPRGSFAGTVTGCNPNQDLVVDAGDISCGIMIIIGGDTACSGGLMSANSPYGSAPSSIDLAESAELSIPVDVPVPVNGRLRLPVVFESKGNGANTTVFSVNYDESWLTFNPADANQDGLPDAITLNLPAGFQASVAFDAADTAGELDFAIYNFTDLDAALADGALMTLEFTAGNPPPFTVAPVIFSYEPPTSLGSLGGDSLLVISRNGSALINSLFEIFLPFAR
jgi:hypothetical protein